MERPREFNAAVLEFLDDVEWIENERRRDATRDPGSRVSGRPADDPTAAPSVR
jgi:hypothetical protein